MKALILYKKHIIFFLVIVSFIIFVLPVFAEEALALPNPLEADSIPELIAKLFKSLVIFVAPPVAAIMIIVGAFQMLTAGGSPEKFERGKKTIFYTVMGLVVILLGMVIAQLVAEILGADEAAQEIQNIRSTP